ncbi:pseudouridylate synthase 1 homolog [Anabrus simplex]|uniref:pseudouridylate synthase 1 homolog n=1 Tax=Anabrus simplex TaxID=316456 RepID=UPI0034DCF99B
MPCAFRNTFCSIFRFSFRFELNLFKRNMSSSPVAVNSLLEIVKKRPLSDSKEEPAHKKAHVDFERVKRKKYAVLLAYSGQGYLGMQRNPGRKTIEEDLLCAMQKAGYISDDAFTTPQTIQFQRAARTDKGVSAARQVVSVKLPEEVSVEKINEHLQEQIRVLSIKRTTKGFNSKSSCDARTYSYTLPTFAFTPADMELKEDYCMSSEVLASVNSTLKIFEGTHNFHNFTSRKRPLDPSAHRYIMSFECGKPFHRKGMEFASIKIKGQSFMLHQIRKMVGLAIAIARGLTTTDTITKAWKSERLDIPVAPSLGLVLEEVHYDRYNQRYGADGIHERLDWSEVEDELNKFREKHIYPQIVDTELGEKSMYNWLLTLPFHSYDVRDSSVSGLPQATSDDEDDDEVPPTSVDNVKNDGSVGDKNNDDKRNTILNGDTSAPPSSN